MWSDQSGTFFACISELLLPLHHNHHVFCCFIIIIMDPAEFFIEQHVYVFIPTVDCGVKMYQNGCFVRSQVNFCMLNNCKMILLNPYLRRSARSTTTLPQNTTKLYFPFFTQYFLNEFPCQCHQSIYLPFSSLLMISSCLLSKHRFSI